jgi:hypothetical protein
MILPFSFVLVHLYFDPSFCFDFVHIYIRLISFFLCFVRMFSSTLLFPRLIVDPLDRLLDMCCTIRKLSVSNIYIYIGLVEIFQCVMPSSLQEDASKSLELDTKVFPSTAGVAGFPKA